MQSRSRAAVASFAHSRLSRESGGAPRDKSLDNDPDAPTLPPEFWENAIIGKYYRPVKTAISMRIDNNVLAWLKAKGNSYQTQINNILKERMIAERRERLTAERARK